MARLTPPRPLEAGDDPTGFDCGRESLNQWFRRHAWRNHESGMSRVTVACDAETGALAGYVALSSGQIERAYLPKSAQRHRPAHIPIVLLGQLAVDGRFQGRGYARSLLFFALTTCVRVSKEIGCFGVLTHPLDDAVRAFYQRWGFEDLPFDPRRSMIVRIVDLEHNGFAGE
jgi:GNAT superfamily N-acetyltransferase